LYAAPNHFVCSTKQVIVYAAPNHLVCSTKQVILYAAPNHFLCSTKPVILYAAPSQLTYVKTSTWEEPSGVSKLMDGWADGGVPLS
jgi:hypothetical protein